MILNRHHLKTPQLLYICCLFFMQSCSKDNALDCFKSNGDNITETLYPGEFSEIEVYDKIEVTIRKGASFKVEVRAGKHIIKSISTKIEKQTLKLINNNTCNFVRGYKRKVEVFVTVPNIRKAFNYGVANMIFEEGYSQDSLLVRAENSGDIYVNGTFKELRTSSHGNGDMYLSGSANSLLIYTNGTNFTHAENFKVKDEIFISTYSIGNAYINADGVSNLDYLIWSDGNIYVTGTPKKTTNLGTNESKGMFLKQP